MDHVLQSQTVFYLTGRRPTACLEPVENLELRPALLARYRDLNNLRYDFPLILTDGMDGGFVRSLSDVVDELLRAIAPAGIDGEGLRKQVLRIEHEIRCLIAGGANGSLSSLWAEAVSRLTAAASASVTEVLRRAGEALAVDGELIDCDASAARRLIIHAWRRTREGKCRKARAELDSLIASLSDILRADFVRSEAGRRPESLRASLGPRHQELFDFDTMARLLALATPGERLTPTRRERIERTLAVLRAQRFFAAPDRRLEPPGRPEPYLYLFESGDAALEAFRERLPAMVELVKAMAVAGLEADGRYVEATHDAYFEAFDERSLGQSDLEQFPDYLVCLSATGRTAPYSTALLEILASGVPVKVLVETDSILEESALGQGHFAFGAPNAQLASLATGLDDTFVLQTTSSNLYQLRERIARGLAWPKASLFCVYTGGTTAACGLPVYLVAAAAMQSRAFPAFSYDPAAGADLASRFSLENNPDPTADWPLAPFEYADETLQRHQEKLAFTLADFALCVRSHAHHLARVPPEAWNGHLVSMAEWLQRPSSEVADGVPCLLAVDGEDFLQKIVVDEKLVQATRRSRESWRRLQDLSGIFGSPAASAPEVSVPAEAPSISAAAEPVPLADATEPERSPDEPWIETSRCSSCNECTQINDRMFAYNDNRQAYIKDPGAGTYRQLVEAAESCQLSIIHPGKPHDANEPGLEELIERAQPFL